MSDFIPVSKPLLTGNEKRYLTQCIETGWISSAGSFVQNFEQGMARFVGRQYGVAVANGSAALDIAVAALGIGQGDEVILPTLTIISCASAVVRAGGTPVVVDCDPKTWNLDVKQVSSRITPKTKAIMAVHLYGLPADMDAVLHLAKKYDLRVIEDAAEEIGQEYKGRPCGSLGHISTFSFYANKNITTGEGGMILTDDANLAEKCRSLRDLCFQGKRFVHEELGWNYRLSNLHAALGVAQLEHLQDTVGQKRRIGQRYNELLADLTHVLQLPLAKTPYANNIYWAFGIVLRDNALLDADGLIAELNCRKVEARPFFWPIHKQPVFLNRGLFWDVVCPEAERVACRGLYLPSGPDLQDQDIDRVVTCLRDALRQ